MYEYRAYLVKVVDGDTVDLMVDLGFSTMVKERFRLEGINAPETRTKDLEEKKKGLESKEFLEKVLVNSDYILVETKKDTKGKYGRYIATIYSATPDKPSLQNINKLLVNKGLAVPAGY